MEANAGSSCAKCGGPTAPGQFGTLTDPQLFFAEAHVSELGGMRMVQGTGERIAVNAQRCRQCGHIELWAPAI